MSTEYRPDRDDASRPGAQPDQPVSGAGQPGAEPWTPGATPLPAPPGWPGQPGSGAPGHPGSGAPGGAWSTDPLSDPLAVGLGGDPRFQRRIEPSVPQRKSRLWLGLLLGFLGGVLIAAPTAFILKPGSGSPDAVKPSASAAGPAALGVFEQSQLAVNQPKFQGELGILAASWLPFVSNCVTDKDAGGPKVDATTTAVVLCRYGNVFIHFVQYKGTAQRDVARAYRERLHSESATLAPGMVAPVQKPRTSDTTVGTYVEYALRGPDKKPVAGIWWDTGDSKAVAIYLETDYQSVGNSWDPLRDLWQRHS